MSNIKIKELRELPVKELEKKLAELKLELMKLNSQVATGTAPKNPSQVRNTKKTIARILTIIKEKNNSDLSKNKEDNKKHE